MRWYKPAYPLGVKLSHLKDEEISEPRAWIREAMKNMVSQNRLEQYELDYFDGLKDEEIPWDMPGPQS